MLFASSRFTGIIVWAAALSASFATAALSQTKQEGRDYFLKLEASFSANQAAAWRKAPGYEQARQNFLTADYRPDLSPSNLRRIEKQARRAARKDTKCREMTLSNSGFANPLGLDRQVERQVLAGQIHNAWSYRVSFAGCGQTYQANFVVIEEPGGDLTHVTTLPGGTLAWPSLQSDVLPKIALTALQTVRRDRPQCIPSGRDRVIKTWVDEERLNSGKMFGVYFSGRWMETWRMQICGRTLDLQVAFRADGSGGASFQAQPRGDFAARNAAK